MAARGSIGANIAEARKLRGVTQHELAREAFVSFSLLSKVEAGHKPASPSLIAAVARALRVHVTQLTGQPYRGETADTDAIHAPIAELRREVTVYDLPPDEYDRPVPALAELEQRVTAATQLRQAASYVKLGAALPALLCDLRAAAHTFEGVSRERAYGLLAETYDAARALAYKLGYLDLASLLVTRHAHAAARSGDPLETAVGDTMRAHELIGVGEFRAAGAVMAVTLGRVEESLTDGEDAAISVYGYLHLEAGLAAARGGDGASATDHPTRAVLALLHRSRPRPPAAQPATGRPRRSHDRAQAVPAAHQVPPDGQGNHPRHRTAPAQPGRDTQNVRRMAPAPDITHRWQIEIFRRAGRCRQVGRSSRGHWLTTVPRRLGVSVR